MGSHALHLALAAPEGNWIALGVAGLYLAACVWVGFRSGGKSSSTAAGFVAGDRQLGGLVMYFITGATIFSAFAFLGAPGWAYSRGAASFYILAFGTLGFVPFYFTGPRAARVGRAFGFVTQAEMVAHRHGFRPIALVMVGISVAAFVPYLALQMKGSGYVLETLSGGLVPEWGGALFVYALVTAYVLKSGVLGVGWTNTLQGVLMLALAWLIGLYVPWKLHGGVGPMFEGILRERPELLEPPGLAPDGEPWGWAPYSTTVAMTMIGFSFWPHLFMKAFSARDEETLKRTVVLYPTFQFFLIPILLVGFAGVLALPGVERSDTILPQLLLHLELNPLLVGLFCAGALAAAMSSGDAILHATASIVVRDGVVTGLGLKPTPERERTWIRGVLLLVALASYLLAVVYRDSIAALLNYAYGPVVQFAPAVLASLYWKRATAAGSMAGLLAGFGTNVLLVAVPTLVPFGVHAGLPALVVNVVALVGVSLLTTPAPESAAFLAIAAGEGEEPS